MTSIPTIPNRPPDLEVVAFGKAAPKGSSVSFPARRGDGSIVMKNDRPVMIHKGDSDSLGAWTSSIVQAAGEKMAATGMQTIPRGVPVVVELVFVRPRSGAHLGTGRNAGVVKPSAPSAPITKPDIDKLTRAVLDAAKSVIWHDDGQVVGAPAWKIFGAPARLELRLWTLPATVGDLLAPSLSAA